MSYDSILQNLDQATNVTVAEVRAAVERVIPQHFEDVDVPTAKTIADDILVHIMNHREPEWELEDVVLDAQGTVWLRISSTQWQQMGRPGVFGHDRPVRPLRLLYSPEMARTSAQRMAALERARDDGAPI